MMNALRMIAPIMMSLCIWLGTAGQAQATISNPLTSIDVETPVYFLAADGSPLVTESHIFSVEAAEDWIRLVPEERQDALLIEAKKGTHDLELTDALALSVPDTEDGHNDLHHILLLLPDGKTLEAIGTYSGIRPRGLFGNVAKNIKKQTNRAYKKARATAKKTISKAKNTARKATKHIKKHTQKAVSHVKKGVRHARNAALLAKREVEKKARRVASKVRKSIPKVRTLSSKEKNLARSVFGNTINYDMVRITNTLGAGGRPWTTNSPPLYTVNVGPDYPNMTTSLERKLLFIHELAHVWQGQHLVPFMLNSAAHQSLSAIHNGGDVNKAYSYKVGKPWNKYNVEQQASIVEHWFLPADRCFENGPCGGGMKTSDSRYRYIRDHIRKNKVN